MSEQRDHVKRPDLPWRIATLTECGRPVEDVKSVITREQFLVRLRKDGQQRTAILTCMTCWHTANRWSTFADNPADAMRRETYHSAATDDQLNRELRGLAALVEAHRDEFDGFLTDLEGTSDLAQQRLKRQRRA